VRGDTRETPETQLSRKRGYAYGKAPDFAGCDNVLRILNLWIDGPATRANMPSLGTRVNEDKAKIALSCNPLPACEPGGAVTPNLDQF
jgi:hypothetical protein